MKYNKLIKLFYKNRFFFILILILFLLILMFFNLFKMIFFILILIVLNIGASAVSRQIPRFNTSIELIMFGTVLCGFAYGVKIAAIFGFISSIVYYLAVGRMSYYVLVFAPLYIIIGIIAGLFNNSDLFIVGMTLTVAYTIISSIIVFFVFNARFDKAIGFAIINTTFNFIMFKYFAPMFLLMMM